MAKSKKTQDFQIVVQHDHQPTPQKQSFWTPDAAIGRAMEAYRYGASTAKVIHKTTGTVIYDGPAGIDLPIKDWYS